ncbi:MAG: pyridoxamine 5'-phosphate oxidase family protein, partial [Actinobacteria bacterium]|nr:pyridoxamine 5'-phosphate oxidase family protein [Actinomycetota bacterium]
MARTYELITDEIKSFIGRQHVFFVGTAPSGAGGHVNVSPKGLDTFRVLDGHTVAWLDLTGSGIETVSHLRDNGRVVVMFCAFEGPPRIVRLHGHGEVLPSDDAGARALLDGIPEYPGSRAVVRVAVERVSTSCGYAVPLMDYRGERSTLIEWAERKGSAGIAEYHAQNNARSLD